MLGAKNRALHIQFKVYPNCNTPVFLELPPLVTIVWISKTVRFVARRRHVLDVAIGFILQKGGEGDPAPVLEFVGRSVLDVVMGIAGRSLFIQHFWGRSRGCQGRRPASGQ